MVSCQRGSLSLTSRNPILTASLNESVPFAVKVSANGRTGRDTDPTLVGGARGAR